MSGAARFTAIILAQLASLALAAAGGVACDGSSSGRPEFVDGGAVDGGPRAPVGFPLNFVAAPCRDRERAPGLEITCGFVELPEQEADPAQGTILLRVARIRAAGVTQNAWPIVYLDGGPGGSSIANAIYYGGWVAGSGIKALLSRGELIAIDLRGTGGSTPPLTCDGFEITTLGPGEPGPGEFSPAAITACRADLSAAGITLSAYNTGAAAHDVAWAITALGLRTFDLVGVSYGARVALEMLRTTPPGLRQVILDSVNAPDSNALTQEGLTLARAYELILSACEADPACTALAPGVRAALPEIVARLDQTPVEVSTHGGTVTLTGRSFLDAIRGALRDGDRVGYLARQVHAARGGDYQFFAAVLGAPRGQGSAGVNLSVMCGEELPDGAIEAIEAAAATVAPPLAHGLVGRFYARACPLWGLTRKLPGVHTPVKTNKLLLLLTGQLDPVATPNGSRQVTLTAPNARYLEVQGGGHAVLHGTCAGAAALGFLTEQSGSGDTLSCSGGNPD